MRYECTMCDYAPEGTGKPAMKSIRKHVRDVHDKKLGWAKQGELPIKHIPTFYGERDWRPEKVSWLDYILNRKKERKKKGEYVAGMQDENI